MWLKRVHNLLESQGSVWLLSVLGLLLFSACSSSDEAAVDKLNSCSYACHYRNIDSTELYARQALTLSASYADGRAEALNNLAFVNIIRMNYAEAEQQLLEATSMTDNQIELMVSYVQQMRLCQRRSMNREFYEFREKAVEALKRINEERDLLSSRQLSRLLYAETEMAIVTSTYYYYVGLERQSADALLQLSVDEMRRDTAQYLNYLYNVGAGGILLAGTPEQIHAEEMDYLNRCLVIARRYGYEYFEAQALEGIAVHTDSLQPAEECLRLFRHYGDVYQIAGAHRTMASCYHAKGDYLSALEQLELALSDSVIYQAPDLVASIHEQLSVAYSAVDNKPQSDYNRNIYLDLQEQTRQDRELEARAGILDKAVQQLNWMILAVLAAIVMLLSLLWLFNWQNKKQKEDHALDDLLEEKTEAVRAAQLRVEKNERRHLEQRAKVSLAMSILPFIDRILYAIEHLTPGGGQRSSMATDSRAVADSGDPVVEGQLNYIRELTDKINEQNDLLTQWIQLRQGELSLHIESFPLQPLFDMVSRGRASFEMKGITLDVEPTGTTVKADRVLTLFMLNTLADNARKFTPRGGRVSISARDCDGSVELSISDTGCGMDAQQLAGVFTHKVHQGHGFGLMNCRGIIEKYRKMSPLFSVCQIAAESEPGRGSRFYFRLPKGIARTLAAVLGLFVWGQSSAAPAQSSSSLPPSLSATDRAHIFADSAYFCNVDGTYERTLQFADSCCKYLNLQYRASRPHGRQQMRMQGDDSTLPAEIAWLHDGVDINYQIVLDIRNECAVAALALHRWPLYTYNNRAYTQLFKELSADNTLADYCRQMQQSQANKRIAVILLLVMLVTIVPAYYMLYYRHRLHARFHRERMKQNDIEMADDELRRAELEDSNLHVANAVLDNCLSTLKHETMYYPSRIRQLVDSGDIDSLTEVTAYYRELYGILIQQAMQQLERIHLHVRPVSFYGQRILGDEHMLRYLFELISEGTTGQVAVESEVRDEKYVAYHIPLAVSLAPLTFQLLRQIVRDHGEATHRRGCGITVNHETITIILPKYNGQV